MGKKKNFYSVESKINVIERYNSGDEGGVKFLSKKLGFRSPNMLTQWFKIGIAGLESKRGKTPSPMRGRPKKNMILLKKKY
ncbi:hypothetical protein LGK95_10875 [Clostridium algoriphilum]|uniref:hypothetical protein n=1 Tax=Clostridium algoriphilum TaxID=198347 RepID=UPI001CF5D9FD|nr:hypothetical protein [Clostridium algoriphilum]MCB2294022.1 hypothetical protein [Clostridium algoriphilum]